ncbi:MAG: hypothetical protein ABIN91_02905 [Mucilaginibacter sp.]|uniref:hypothetical protein n=1 Tax=Mucilaginibacter sp. TaxID=1882438 RepID=UPI0032674720
MDFAENVIDNFKTNDPKLQKRICNYIGWNWSLEKKKLTFSRYEWFTDIQHIKKHFEQEKARLEPIKTFAEYRQTASFGIVRSLLSALISHIGTAGGAILPSPLASEPEGGPETNGSINNHNELNRP